MLAPLTRCLARWVAACAILATTSTTGAPNQAVLALANQQKQPLLDTLKDLVNIESGSGDREGLDQISPLVYDRLKTIEMTFERRRPPLESNPAAAAVAKHAQTIFADIGKELKVTDTVAGGGTDAAFAALANNKPVIEGFGLQSFGAHANDNEYIHIDSIEPRLYLATRLIMDVSQGKNK